MLGWLLNLGFAGGGGVISLQEFVPLPALVKRTISEDMTVKRSPSEVVIVKRTVSKDVER